MYLNDWSLDHVELVKLAIATCAEYDRRCDLSEDPSAPWRSMPGWPPFNRIRREVVDAAYERALGLGFEGDIHRWARYVYERRDETERSQPCVG
jgi:hypothetical protein